ncbi:NADH:flavin oxidoreductase/NADH oxidase [Sodiomyces alkalinus F11]|uniref:NADH:flavin oxidoreductase/NADH oxidase n=1 Tax=Sodiomyces alkalinus (strain CBS 110278 / VKM F-3762 / F11) TaxID=1314773 RepID=A0A3N2PYZ8_SODAK|nr:NADH:flavin oxidoreductase/NADH oxidase [Sodiomyces alkalinus F11]ROT39751.1 NADH:flavin oxidoreductase/NADH oxidase [Sodiomyces alkalinus F11]
MVGTATKATQGIPYFTPAQEPPAGTPTDVATAPTLFQPLRIRDVELANRLAVSPMCMYSAQDGHLTDFHLVHLGQFALRGAGLTIVEATAVEPRGRISPEDSGLWSDSQIEPLKRVVDFVHAQNHKIGIQLAHAGRKASTLALWHLKPGTRCLATADQGGWPDDVVAPSAIPFAAEGGWPEPRALTLDEVEGVVRAFADAARRAVAAGIDVVEIHAAHGYLLTEFLSPLTNRRTDRYGGSFENRIRLAVEVIRAVRAVIPAGMPLFVRISATEWMEHGHETGQRSWDLEESIRFAKRLPELGVDLLDVSSGGNQPDQRIEVHPYYQVSLAGKIRDALRAEGKDMLIGAVGMISEAEMARSIVQVGEGVKGEEKKDRETVEVDEEHGQKTQADLVFVGRQFLREPNFVLKIAEVLGVPVKWPNQYLYGAPRRKL